jgi:hypothetical protein
MIPAEKTPRTLGHAHMGQTELGPAYTVTQAGDAPQPQVLEYIEPMCIVAHRGPCI